MYFIKCQTVPFALYDCKCTGQRVEHTTAWPLSHVAVISRCCASWGIRDGDGEQRERAQYTHSNTHYERPLGCVALRLARRHQAGSRCSPHPPWVTSKLLSCNVPQIIRVPRCLNPCPSSLLLCLTCAHVHLDHRRSNHSFQHLSECGGGAHTHIYGEAEYLDTAFNRPFYLIYLCIGLNGPWK